MKKQLTLILFSLLLGGCGAMGTKYDELASVKADESLVYIYRPSKFFQGGTWPTVFINGEERFTLKNGGFVYFLTEPGKHNIKLGKAHIFSNWAVDDIEIDINTEPSKTYFYKLVLQGGDVNAVGSFISISGQAGIVKVPEVIALDDLQDLNSSM